jgi:Ca-activated chloride channel family protein
MMGTDLLKAACSFLVVVFLLPHIALSSQQTATTPQNGDAPASIGLLLDNSKSMAKKRNDMVAAMQMLVQASNPQDEFFVVNFNDHPYLDQDFTSDRNLVQKALERADARGGTAFYDAVSSSAAHLRKSAKYQRRILVVVSDGGDNESHLNRKEMLRQFQQPGSPTVDCIDPLGSDARDSTNLEKLAKQTGGLFFHVKNAKQFGEVAVRIAQEIRKQ